METGERAHIRYRTSTARGWSHPAPAAPRPHTVCSVHSSRATWLVLVALATVQRPRAHPAPHTRGRASESTVWKNAVLHGGRSAAPSGRLPGLGFVRLRRGTCYVHVLKRGPGRTLDPWLDLSGGGCGGGRWGVWLWGRVRNFNCACPCGLCGFVGAGAWRVHSPR